jgi:hypothetical protein
MSAPFYATGLKFLCKRCSACCRYDAGFVFLSEDDLENLTAELKMDRNAFIATFCRWVSGQNGAESLSLKEKSNNDCIFWNCGCTVYQARPMQCRTFPFWESIAASAFNWETAASGCPGINCGNIHTGKVIGEYIKLSAAQPIIKR